MDAPAAAGGTIAATLTWHEAGRHDWQAVVVGAGTAGAATALRLAAGGLRTLLVERHDFPRDKVCGCCLSQRAVCELGRLGDGALPAAAVPLGTVRLAHRGRWARLPLPAGRVVSRAALDASLVRLAIAAGAHWLPGVQVAVVDDTADRPGEAVTVLLRPEGRASSAGPPLRASLVVLAAGLVDHVRIAGPASATRVPAHRIARGSRIGVGGILPPTCCELPAGELVMAVGRDGYCGIVRLEDGRVDLAAAIDRAAVARHADPAEVIIDILEQATPVPGRLLPTARAVRDGAFRVTPALTRHAPLVAGSSGRIFRIGDAAAYVEPFTGEGMGWALSSARILAESVLGPSGLLPPAEAAAAYRAAHRRSFGPVHARCRFVAGILRRPLAVAAAVAVARGLPWAARRLLPAVIGVRRMGGG